MARTNSTSIALRVAVLLVLIPALAVAGDTGSPREFLQGLYAHYPAKAGKKAFDPLGKEEASVFDASMRILIRADRVHANGEVGVANDSDPICQCQDDGGMTSEIRSITATGASEAIAHVSLKWDQAQPVDVRIVLRKVDGHWRIHDIGSGDQPSLRAAIVAGLKEPS